jgi:hypothetical protein
MKSLNSIDIKDLTDKILTILSDEFEELKTDINGYSPILIYITMILETIIKGRYSSAIVKDTQLEITIIRDAKELMADNTASIIRNIIISDFIKLKSKSKGHIKIKNLIKSKLAYVLNKRNADVLNYGHVKLGEGFQNIKYYEYKFFNVVNYQMYIRKRLVKNLKILLPQKYHGLANIIFLLPVSLMEGSRESLKVTKDVLGSAREIKISQGFIDFEFVSLLWSKHLFPKLKTTSIQHGGGYYHRMHPALSERFETQYSDTAYNWIGITKNRFQNINFPESLKLEKKDLKYAQIKRIVVLSTYEGTGVSNLMSIKSVPQTLEEIYNFENFIAEYTVLLEKYFEKCELIFRSPPKSPGYTNYLNENWKLCDHKMMISDYNDGETLFIIDNLNTTLYQMLEAQIPFVFLHNEQLYSTNKNFNMFKKQYLHSSNYFNELSAFIDKLDKHHSYINHYLNELNSDLKSINWGKSSYETE